MEQVLGGWGFDGNLRMLKSLPIVRVRRQYNRWVSDQTVEDYALRFTADRARRWSPFRVGNTAMGAISFLACEAIGASITLAYGFTNAMAAIVLVTMLVLATGLPIAYYAAKFGVDMDLLTRGGGFGYIGSTFTSLIYAGFTFILLALEAAIMSEALTLCLDIPLWLSHMISALIVLPIAIHGIRKISWMQVWTQPVWLILQLSPLVFVILAEPGNCRAGPVWRGCMRRRVGSRCWPSGWPPPSCCRCCRRSGSRWIICASCRTANGRARSVGGAPC